MDYLAFLVQNKNKTKQNKNNNHNFTSVVLHITIEMDGHLENESKL